MPEINEGYEIIAAEVYAVTDFGREERVVLGRMDTRYGTMFVTWESQVWTFSDGEKRFDYFWGHYHDDERKARADYHRRLIEKYE